MLKKLAEHKGRFAAVCALVCILACVRAFEDVLFYDPLLAYFKTDYTAHPIPAINLVKLSLNLMLRYAINSLLSLAIIFAIFNKTDLVRFSALLYAGFFVVLIVAFLCVLTFYSDNKMLLFYIRRFMIQPLLLLLFLPGFYFQERNIKK